MSKPYIVSGHKIEPAPVNKLLDDEELKKRIRAYAFEALVTNSSTNYEKMADDFANDVTELFKEQKIAHADMTVKHELSRAINHINMGREPIEVLEDRLKQYRGEK